MSNLFSKLKLSNKPSRNGFDLSKRNIFSAKVGELLPVYCKEVIPGDKFKINVKSFTRTMPVNTAAYTRIKEYYDFFFVPTNLMWNKFNSWVTEIGNESPQHSLSIARPAFPSPYQPYFTLNAVSDWLGSINQDYIDQSQDATAPSKNFFGFNRAELSAKLMDYLGYGDVRYNWTGVAGTYAENVALNPFPLLAYQKIYSDYYRNSQWESANPTTFNVDYVNGINYELPIDGLDMRSESMFDLRYANWNKDLFTGLLPNSQYGDAASVDLSSLLAPKSFAFSTLYTNIPSDDQLYSKQGINSVGVLSKHVTNSDNDSAMFGLDATAVRSLATSLGLTTDKLQSTLTVLALRQAEALQRLKEIKQSNNLDYVHQVDAIFGVKPSNALSERCTYIDGFSSMIDINEVVNTNINNGTSQNIADIAGKGVGSQDCYVDFTSDVHGYIMCIYHAVPQLDYSLETRIARQNLKTTPSDYANPVLDKIGMVQVPMIEMTNDIELNDGRLLGYAPRYYDYKTDVDEIHGSARNRNSAWVAPFNDQYLKMLLYPDFNAQESIRDISFEFFKVNPFILDPIFAAQTASDSTTDTDQLLINCYFDVKAVRNLDYNGLPM